MAQSDFVLRDRPEQCFPQLHNRLAFRAHALPVLAALLDEARRRYTRPWLKLLNGTLTRSYVRSLTGHERAVNTCRFAAGSATVLSASVDETVRLWSADDGRELLCVKDVRGSNAAKMPFDLARDGSLLACSDHAGLVTIWDAATGELVTQHPLGVDVRDIMLSERGQTMIVVERRANLFVLVCGCRGGAGGRRSAWTHFCVGHRAATSGRGGHADGSVGGSNTGSVVWRDR